MLARRKMQTEATVWQKLPEHLQREEITEAHNAALDIVKAVTELVATRGVDLIHAKFKSASIDDKCNVKIILTGHTDDEQLTALNRVGSKILKIMVLDHEQFNAERNEIEPDADQPEMFNDDEKPEATVEGAIADQLREAGYDVTEGEDGSQEINPPAEMEDTPDADDEPQEPDEGEGEEAIAEEVATDETESAPEDPYLAGQEACASGQGPDDNPFDGGTEAYLTWQSGYTDASDEIGQLVLQGYNACKEGQPSSKNPWKAGSRENGWWAEGYDKADSEDLPEE